MKALAIFLALVFVVLCILAATGLMAFAPPLGIDGTHHMKHAVFYAVLALLCLVWARFANASAR
jgi:hypothetical protein